MGIMRVISGTSKGRRLSTLRGQTLRPTSGRIKESIFGILGKEVEGKVVLDLFAGTGNLAVEALSRGAKKAFLVERGRQALRLIQKNLSRCGMEGLSEILPDDACRAIRILEARKESFDLIFIDPPYEKGLIKRTLEGLSARRIYHEGSLLIIQHDRREPLPETLEGWSLIRERRIGDTIISFLMPVPSAGTGKKDFHLS